jgi:DnaJ-class molecular chaperone
MDDLYKVLGVPRDATQDQIKSAYRKLARRLHPDVNPGNKQKEESFKRISAAYDILGDAAKRARYDAGEIDATGNERARQGYRQYSTGGGGGKGFGGFHFGENVDDILAELLRRKDKGRRSSSGFFGEDDLAGKGADAQYSLKIELPEAVLGATKRITLPTGKNLNVKVPPGSKDGAVLRLKGQGGPGRFDGPAGDALIELKIVPHPFLSREGNDILVTLPVTLPEAVFGAKVTVPTIDGKVTVTIPPGSNSGTVLRLKGKGALNGRERGDQLITLKVMLPDQLDSELTTFLRDWATRYPYDVRAKLAEPAKS